MIWRLAHEGDHHVPMYSLNASQNTSKYFDQQVVVSRYRRHRYREHLPFLLSVCRFSRDLHIETSHMFFEGTTFVSSSTADDTSMTSFVSSVPGAGECVRGLYSDYFSRIPSTGPNATTDTQSMMLIYRTSTMILLSYLPAISRILRMTREETNAMALCTTTFIPLIPKRTRISRSLSLVTLGTSRSVSRASTGPLQSQKSCQRPMLTLSSASVRRA